MAPTSWTPMYSNAAIQILSYALEAITNTTYSTLLSKHILDPLKMTHSSVTAPQAKEGIIPFNESYSDWDLPAGDEAP